MPHESGPDSPITWMNYAKADLALASIQLPPGAMYDQLCFHAQQAAEKALKALLICLGTDFPNTHSMQKLIDLLPTELQSNPAILQSTILTAYAVQTRYPGDIEEIPKDEYEEAVRIASEVVDLAQKTIQAYSKP